MEFGTIGLEMLEGLLAGEVNFVSRRIWAFLRLLTVASTDTIRRKNGATNTEPKVTTEMDRALSNASWRRFPPTCEQAFSWQMVSFRTSSR